MTTEELLSTTKRSFNRHLVALDLQSCQGHVREIVATLGGTSFKTYMRRMTREVDKYLHIYEKDMTFYYAVTEESYPFLVPVGGVLERLTRLALLLIKLRTEADLKDLDL